MTHTPRFSGAVDGLVDDLRRLSRRRQAAFFAICGEALLPLYNRFHVSTGFGDLDTLVQALTRVDAWVTGSDLADTSGLAASLEAITPHGDDFDAPSSTVAQDAIICVDMAIRCARPDGVYDLDAVWYALEPLMTALTLCAYNVLQLGSGDDEHEWLDRVVDEPEMARALRYCHHTAHALMGLDTITPDLLEQLRGGSSALHPAIVEEMLMVNAQQ